jgi:atypical dual specificity phosphatase
MLSGLVTLVSWRRTCNPFQTPRGTWSLRGCKPTLAEMAPRYLSNTASVIIPSALYLGPRSAASSVSFLTANSITHVLSIGISPRTKVEGITYHRLGLNDDFDAPILPTLASAIEIIDSALQSNKGRGRILVHCFAGVSRSPTIIIGYLMKQRGLPLRNALGHIMHVRPRVSPNYGFLAQLKTLEVELYGVSTLDVDELPRQEAARLALFSDVEQVIINY